MVGRPWWMVNLMVKWLVNGGWLVNLMANWLINDSSMLNLWSIDGSSDGHWLVNHLRVHGTSDSESDGQYDSYMMVDSWLI